jgi:hypothetical protein
MITIDNEDNPLMNSSFVNDTLIPKAFKFCSNPKQNISEGGALMLSILFTRYFNMIDLNVLSLPNV